jgi:hypothetical protein
MLSVEHLLMQIAKESSIEPPELEKSAAAKCVKFLTLEIRCSSLQAIVSRLST